MYLFEEIVIKGIEQNPIIEIRGINDHPKVEYERLDIEGSVFLAPFILVSSNGMLDIPIVDDKILDISIKEIAPHFNKVERITTNEQQVVIRLQNVRESSKIHLSI